MKLPIKIAALAFAGALFATQTLAHDHGPSFSRFSDSHVAYADVLESVPVYSGASSAQKQVCEKVQVPIYAGNDKTKQAENVVAGAVVGAIFGKIVTGNNNGAATGAVIGAVAGANKQKPQIIGYRKETQCHMVDVAGKVKYYQSRIRLEGRIYRVQTGHRLTPGGTVKMYVHN